MKTKSEIFVDCAKRLSGHYQEETKAKDDCKIHVDAEIDLLANQMDRPLTTQEKAMLKKFGKALADGKSDTFKEEGKALARIVAGFFNPAEIEVALSEMQDTVQPTMGDE